LAANGDFPTCKIGQLPILGMEGRRAKQQGEAYRDQMMMFYTMDGTGF
jgi:hypothetical protein